LHPADEAAMITPGRAVVEGDRASHLPGLLGS
jgi:hypothetical protein